LRCEEGSDGIERSASDARSQSYYASHFVARSVERIGKAVHALDVLQERALSRDRQICLCTAQHPHAVAQVESGFVDFAEFLCAIKPSRYAELSRTSFQSDGARG
jgi:hypothetical protein